MSVVAGEVAAVRLTNTASVTPPADPPATTEPTEAAPAAGSGEPIDLEQREVVVAVSSSGTQVEAQPELPATGAERGAGSLVAALALLLTDAVMVAVRRRRLV